MSRLVSDKMHSLDNGAVGVLLSAALATFIAYAVYTAIYNVYFHPLAEFPGPRLAATTTYWKAYLECILSRSFCHELVDLHARYGETVWNSTRMITDLCATQVM